MTNFRCEDIILRCDDEKGTYDAKTCCEEMFKSEIYTFQGKCYSTHGTRLTQSFPGSTDGLQITAVSSKARK